MKTCHRLVTMAMAAIISPFVGFVAANADFGTDDTSGTADLQQVTMQHSRSAEDVKRRMASNDGHTYTMTELCKNSADKHARGGACSLEGKACGKGDKGTQWNFLQDKKYFGTTCLMPRDLKDLERITPEMMVVEFRRLTWPQGDLVLQPSRGWTLVNAPTVVSTTTVGTQTQSIGLLGQHVEIQAWPRYTWDFGDGSQMTTEGPGRRVVAKRGQAIQDVNLSGAIFHRYQKSADVRVRLDLTYSGRYRIGGGRWIDIPGTLTVAGTSQPLSVEEASPELTG